MFTRSRVHRDINIVAQTMIDTPLSAEQLASPRISISVIKPLSDDYYRLQHPAILFALFVCHIHFARISSHALSLHSYVNLPTTFLLNKRDSPAITA